MKRWISFLMAVALFSTTLPAGASQKLTWRDCISPKQLIDAGNYHTVAVRADGTVAAAGRNDTQWYNPAQCDVGGWTDVIAVSAGYNKTIALRRDGTVLYAGIRDYSQGDVKGWTDIVAVSAGVSHCVGLKRDGTVVACGDNYYGQCSVEKWTDIVAVSAGNDYTLGLRADGTVAAAGSNEYLDRSGRMDVGGWSGIRAIAAGGAYSIGLRDDGTAVAAGINYYREPMPVDDWRGLMAVVSASNYCLGLSQGGMFVNVADERWSNLIAADRDSEGNHTVGLRRDGTAFADGDNSFGQCDVAGWQNLMTVPQGPDFTNGQYTEMPDSRALMRHVFDKAGLFSADESDRMERLMQGLYSLYGFDSVILTTGDPIEGALSDYTMDYYHNLRTPEDYPDGTIFCISTSLMEYYEATRGTGIALLTERGVDDLSAAVMPFMSTGDYSGGVLAYLDYVRKILAARSPEATAEQILRADVTPDSPRGVLGGVVVDFGAWNISEDSVMEVKTFSPQPFEDQGIVATVYDLKLSDTKGIRTEFLTPVTVTLPCSAAADEAAFIQYFDEKLAQWQLVPCTRDTNARTISFLTDHFSFVCVSESTGQIIDNSLFSYIGDYRGPLTPVGISSGDINKFLDIGDLGYLKQVIDEAEVPLDTAASRGVWWLMNIGGGVGYSHELGLTRLMEDASWKRWNPILTYFGAFMTVARIAHQASRGVSKTAIFRDNALDLVESTLAIVAISANSVPLSFAALGFFIAGQIDEAYQWKASEPDNWPERTYLYFNQHDAWISLSDFDIHGEYHDSPGYVRLDLGGKGCAAVIDAIYRKYAMQPREMVAAYNRFIDEYCNYFWEMPYLTKELNEDPFFRTPEMEVKGVRENMRNNYYKSKILNTSYITISMPENLPSVNSVAIQEFEQNFRKRLLSSMQPLMQKMVERIYNDISGKLLNELREKWVPVLNKEMSFDVIDPDLDAGQKFDQSRFSGKDSVIEFVDPIFAPSLSSNERYPVKAEPGSNTVYRCTFFHWISMGRPLSMVFINNTPGKSEVQRVKLEPKFPVTTLWLEAPKATPAPESGNIIGSWQGEESYPLIPGYESSIVIDITAESGVYDYILNLTSPFLQMKGKTVYGRVVKDGDSHFVELVSVGEGEALTGKEPRFGVLGFSSSGIIGIRIDFDDVYSALLKRVR